MLSLMEENFPASVKFTRPEGGMFIWVELPEGLDSCQQIGQSYFRTCHFKGRRDKVKILPDMFYRQRNTVYQ